MKLRIILIIISIIASGASIFAYFNIQKNKIKKICFNSCCFNVEVADEDNEWQKGLMDRDRLEQDQGMLFVFPSEEKHSFWMKETKIPLDIIWMDKNKKIVAIEKADPCQADPCQLYDPKVQSKYVLEINAPLAEKYNIKIGDKADIK